MKRRSALVLLNLLSFSRFALALMFVLLDDALVRLTLIVLAGLTDVVDGWIARSRGLTTRAGAIIDPLADRAFVLTALVTLTFEGALLGWHLALLVIRDLATGAAWVATRLLPPFQQVAFQARSYGKVVTLLQFVALIVAVLQPRWVPPIAVAVAAVSLLALVDYGRFVWRERAV